MRRIRLTFLFIAVIFLLPAAASAAWWEMTDRPGSWRAADWSSSGVLADAAASDEAGIFVLAARTGGLKGALSVHSWIVTRKRGADRFDRYDVVAWGTPLRRNGYPADGRWYSNVPHVVHAVTGAAAEALIPRVEAAIDAYPYAKRGDYRIWPGPNSNSFVAHVLRAVPELGASMPPNAVGRDYLPGAVAFDWSPKAGDLRASLGGGLLGFAVGARSGLELNFFGLVAGFDVLRPALKIPGIGRVDLLP